MKVTSRIFGKTKRGEEVTAWTIQGENGFLLEVLDWGGRVVRLLAPDREGTVQDVALGFDSPAGWEEGDPYYGALIGRFANRIGKGRFTLDGRDYVLECNNFPGNIGCALHGSTGGWHDRLWKVTPFERADEVGIVLSYVSPDGEGGFPGQVTAEVTYTVTRTNVWRVSYKAETTAATPFSMTQHAYFNLAGEASGSVENHTLEIRADEMLPYGVDQIPTGERLSVKGTPFDFTTPHRIGDRIDEANAILAAGRGYDHCWVISGESGTLRTAAILSYAGRRLEVRTTAPGIQVYTGNWIPEGQKAKGSDCLSPRCGVALETGGFPDAPNKPDFPSAILRPGEVFTSVTEFDFGLV